MARYLSPAIFGIVLICFFLPWISISCQGQPVVTFTGTQLVTGTTVESPPILGSRERHRIPADLFCVLVALLAVAGLGLGFLRGRGGALAGGAAAGLSLAALLVFKARADDAVLKNGVGLLKAEYRSGFWLTLLLLLAAVGLNARAYWQSGSEAARRGRAVIPGGRGRFCTRCGAPNPGDAGYCGSCGERL